MTKEADVVRILKPYLMAFPSSHVKEDTLIIYARALSRLSSAELEAAMMKLLDTLPYFPAVAQIFEAARSVRETAEGSGIPTAAEAWEEVQKLVKTCHLYKPWTYSCPEVQRAAECYGKYELCNLLESEVGIARAQFMRMYQEICKRREEVRENTAVLAALPSAKKLAGGKIVQLAEAKRA